MDYVTNGHPKGFLPGSRGTQVTLGICSVLYVPCLLIPEMGFQRQLSKPREPLRSPVLAMNFVVTCKKGKTGNNLKTTYRSPPSTGWIPSHPCLVPGGIAAFVAPKCDIHEALPALPGLPNPWIQKAQGWSTLRY